jgi:hypothetical protein
MLILWFYVTYAALAVVGEPVAGGAAAAVAAWLVDAGAAAEARARHQCLPR